MLYCQPSDVRNALAPGGASSGTNTAADLSDQQLTDAITEAGDRVDGYIGTTYAATDTIPDLVKYWTRDIAAYYATLTWRKSKDFTPNDPVRLRYQDTMNQLTKADQLLPNPLPTADQASVVNPMSPVQQALFSPDDYVLGWPYQAVYEIGR